ncbi:MAG: PQQ-binding-like beta-propeller repeat protein [Rhodobacteraceae bacterium]|nr:PQQ-binding-like beta-propeller repeat protein [Paracoccaceae bacterium]
MNGLIAIVTGRVSAEHAFMHTPLVSVHIRMGRFLTGFATFLLITCPMLAESAGDWPNWRGPNGNGSITTGNYPVKWDASRVAWKIALPGKGTSTPVIHDGRVYITTPDGGQDAVLAFDLAGRELWRTKLGPATPPKHRSLASSCNASPVTDGKGLFVYFKSGHFAALEFDGEGSLGRRIWWSASGANSCSGTPAPRPWSRTRTWCSRECTAASRGWRASTRRPANCAGSRRAITSAERE